MGCVIWRTYCGLVGRTLHIRRLVKAEDRCNLERTRGSILQQPLRTKLKTELGVVVALGTLWNAIARMGLTVKKRSSGPPSKIART